jgi:peroxiredoxin
LELHAGFKPKTINLSEYIKGRDVILMGLPGAFTPT